MSMLNLCTLDVNSHKQLNNAETLYHVNNHKQLLNNVESL